MRKECLQIEEQIWGHARTGAELDSSAISHIEGCPGCAQTLAEAKYISSALKTAIEIPITPDCRAAVAAHISPRARFNWGYAVGIAVVLLAVVVFAKSTLSPVKDAQHIAKKPAHLKQTIKLSSKDLAVKPAPAKVRTNIIPHRHLIVKPVRNERIYTASKNRHMRPVQAAQKPLRKQAVTTAQHLPEPKTNQAPQVTQPDKVIIQDSVINRPVAIAIVHWPTADETNSTDCDYAYSEHNAQTGETTICSVKRSGNSIEINMKTEPEKQEKPVRRSMNYETNQNA